MVFAISSSLRLGGRAVWEALKRGTFFLVCSECRRKQETNEPEVKRSVSDLFLTESEQSFVDPPFPDPNYNGRR